MGDKTRVIRALHAWKRLLGAFCKKRPAVMAGVAVRGERYARVRGQLMEACSQMMQNPRDQHFATYERLHKLAQPWMTIESVKGAKKQILRDVICKCDILEQDLTGKRSLKRFSFVGLALLCAASFAVFFVYLQRSQFTMAETFVAEIGSTVHEVVYFFKSLSFPKKIGIVTAILVISCIQFLRHTRAS